MDPHIWPSKSRMTSSNIYTALCEDTGCSSEDLSEAMNDREKWRERVRDIHASGMTWWWFLYCYLPCVQQDTWRNGYRRWFPKLLRRQSSGGCRFNPHNRWVTIQEYLILVPGYGQWNQNRWPRWFNKGRSSKFREGSWVWQTSEEGRRTYRPECCGNNKDEDDSLKTLNEKINNYREFHVHWVPITYSLIPE